MTSLAGIGLYSPKQAEHLTGIKARKIRRWLFGIDTQGRHYEGVWTPKPQKLGIDDALSFQDLIEIRFVHYFRNLGVSLQTIRLASENAKEIFGKDYPFSSPRFRSDGESIFATALDSDAEGMLDIAKRQNVIRQVIEPSLYTDVVYFQDEAIRWVPDSEYPDIIVDPQFAFGKPIIQPSYMPTRVLFDAWNAEEKNAAIVARQYEVTEDEVERAVRFELRMAGGAVLH